MAWLVLALAGVLEAVWALALGASKNFRNKRAIGVFAVAMPASMAGLAYAMTHLPTGTAYAVWVGIGATLTVAWGLVTRKEAVTVGRTTMLLLLVGSVVGLKVVS